MSRNDLAIYVGNLSDKVTEDLLYELFLQVGPVANVNIPKQKPFGFVQFKHQCSVPYAMHLMNGISLFGKPLKIAPPKGASNPTFLPPLGVPVPFPQHSMPQRPLVHPLSLHGRLGPPRNPHPRKGKEEEAEHRDRERPRSRHTDHMMPSKRSNRKRSPTKSDIDDIPDLLGSLFDPLYSGGGGGDDPAHRPSEPSMEDRKRDGSFDNRAYKRDFHEGKGRGSRHSHYNPKREHPSHSSNRRRHF